MAQENEQVQGVIGTVPINGRPVIYKLVPQSPSRELRRRLPHLAVVSWTYRGDSNNGMPSGRTNKRMMELEDILSPLFDQRDDSVHAYSRTGDNLKEFTYYVADASVFMARLNEALVHLPRFPIEITFSQDEDWSDFRDIASMFDGPGATDA